MLGTSQSRQYGWHVPVLGSTAGTRRRTRRMGPSRGYGADCFGSRELSRLSLSLSPSPLSLSLSSLLSLSPHHQPLELQPSLRSQLTAHRSPLRRPPVYSRYHPRPPPSHKATPRLKPLPTPNIPLCRCQIALITLGDVPTTTKLPRFSPRTRAVIRKWSYRECYCSSVRVLRWFCEMELWPAVSLSAPSLDAVK